MGAWLKKCGYSAYGGYPVIREKFVEIAPDYLQSKVMHCLAEASFLEFALEGRFENMLSLPSFAECKRRAYACLDECEKTVLLMEDNLKGFGGKE